MLFVDSDTIALVHRLEDEPSTIVLAHNVVFLVVGGLWEVHDTLLIFILIVLLQVEGVAQLEAVDVTQEEDVAITRLIVGGLEW